MLDSHPLQITLLISQLRTMSIIFTAGIWRLQLCTRQVCRKAPLELMPHSNITRIPRQKARAAQVVVLRSEEDSSFRKPYPRSFTGS